MKNKIIVAVIGATIFAVLSFVVMKIVEPEKHRGQQIVNELPTQQASFDDMEFKLREMGKIEEANQIRLLKSEYGIKAEGVKEYHDFFGDFSKHQDYYKEKQDELNAIVQKAELIYNSAKAKD